MTVRKELLKAIDSTVEDNQFKGFGHVNRDGNEWKTRRVYKEKSLRNYAEAGLRKHGKRNQRNPHLKKVKKVIFLSLLCKLLLANTPSC